ncbi:MAG: asparagine--tRNA ligase [Proteobacteria bacterium]|nr:asparagine--tRNA ligase [Pseudomonadota bacterium]
MRWDQRIYIRDLTDKIGETHTLQGWVHFSRKSSKVRFLGLRDGSGIIQCVLVDGETEDETYRLFSQLKQETSIRLTGLVQKSERSQFGVEILVQRIEILGTSSQYPITPKEHGVDFLLGNRHLWLRSKKQVVISKIRSTVIQAIREFLFQHHFIQIDSPVLTKSVGEDPKGLFSVDYFDLGKTYLAQTGQLYLEAAVPAHGNVFCFGPTFRAEKSKTRRHLTEFWMLEGEMAFFDNDDNMDLQEDLIKFIIRKVLDECQWHLQQLDRDVEKLRQCLNPFQRISYNDAIEILKKKGGKLEWGEDLGATDETQLTEDSAVPAFVYDYPKAVKAFYMKENEADEKTVKCSDLLAPEGFGEIIGGSQREDSLEKLKRRILEKNLPMENYEWYLDIRRYGSVIHAGFGLGLERLVGWICGIEHIREAIPFPRLMERVTP